MANVNEFVIQSLLTDSEGALYIKTLTGPTYKITPGEGEPDVGIALGQLTDVDTGGVSNGQTLIYNSGSGEWTPGNLPSFGASNGIVNLSSTFELGGSLTKNTTIQGGANTLTLTGLGSFTIAATSEIRLASGIREVRVTSTEVNLTHAKYFDNYHESYTLRSLVDKAYVDSVVTGGVVADIVYHSKSTTFTGATVWDLENSLSINAFSVNNFDPTILMDKDQLRLKLASPTENVAIEFLSSTGKLNFVASSANMILYPQGTNATVGDSLINKTYADTKLAGQPFEFSASSLTSGHTIIWDNTVQKFRATPLTEAFWRRDTQSTLRATTTVTTDVGSVPNITIRNRASLSSSVELDLSQGISHLKLLSPSGRQIAVELGDPFLNLANLDNTTLSGPGLLIQNSSLDIVSYNNSAVDKFIRYDVNTGLLNYDINRSGSYTNRTLVDKEYVDSIGGGGSVGTASNLGSGSGLFAQKVGSDLQFKSIVGGPSISVTSTSTEVIISSNISAGPENSEAFLGDGITTEFMLATTVDSPIVMFVDVGGQVQLRGENYTVSGKTVTFVSGAPLAGTRIGIHFMSGVAISGLSPATQQEVIDGVEAVKYVTPATLAPMLTDEGTTY